MSEVKDYGNGYNSENSVAIIWSIEDVEYRLEEYYKPIFNPELKYTKENCMDILHNVVDDHDAGYGVTWESIDYAIENYFYDELEKARKQ
tara:strand:- start:298 stop:567 length:270 start_codon:yes stop_codon:yes gene_type:complete